MKQRRQARLAGCTALDRPWIGRRRRRSSSSPAATAATAARSRRPRRRAGGFADLGHRRRLATAVVVLVVPPPASGPVVMLVLAPRAAVVVFEIGPGLPGAGRPRGYRRPRVRPRTGRKDVAARRALDPAGRGVVRKRSFPLQLGQAMMGIRQLPERDGSATGRQRLYRAGVGGHRPGGRQRRAGTGAAFRDRPRPGCGPPCSRPRPSRRSRSRRTWSRSRS